MRQHQQLFDDAARRFGELETTAIDSRRDEAMPSSADAVFFGVAAASAMLLLDRGKDELLQLQRDGVVHASTVSGSSLGLAVNTIKTYYSRDLTTPSGGGFSRDQYEQLKRTVRSAAALLFFGRDPEGPERENR